MKIDRTANSRLTIGVVIGLRRRDPARGLSEAFSRVIRAQRNGIDLNSSDFNDMNINLVSACRGTGRDPHFNYIDQRLHAADISGEEIWAFETVFRRLVDISKEHEGGRLQFSIDAHNKIGNYIRFARFYVGIFALARGNYKTAQANFLAAEDYFVGKLKAHELAELIETNPAIVESKLNDDRRIIVIREKLGLDIKTLLAAHASGVDHPEMEAPTTFVGGPGGMQLGKKAADLARREKELVEQEREFSERAHQLAEAEALLRRKVEMLEETFEQRWAEIDRLEKSLRKGESPRPAGIPPELTAAFKDINAGLFPEAKPVLERYLAQHPNSMVVKAVLFLLDRLEAVERI